MSTELHVGRLLDENAKRDAIHFALAPVIASEILSPGDHVSLDSNGEAFADDRDEGRTLGIVDPFLKSVVLKGERFWLFLYPNTITSLRHEWTHPQFDGEASRYAALQASDKYAESERWLRQYAADHSPYAEPDKAYRTLLEGLRDRQLFFYGADLHSRADLDDEDELREHAERVLGRSIDFGQFSFSCSC